MNCRNALGSTSHADKGCPLKVPARAVSNAKKQSIPAQTGLTALVRVFCADGAEPRRGLWSSRCPCSCGHSCFSPSLLALWRLPRMGNSIWPQTAQRLPLPKRQSQRLPMARRWWRIRIRFFVDTEQNKLFWPMDMPFWVRMAASPDADAPSYLLQRVAAGSRY